MKITLRDVQDSDLPIFFQHQQEEEARYMAAFTSKNATDKETFQAHWAKIRESDSTINKTILLDEVVVGHVSSFVIETERDISYWIGKAHWGKGIATRALSEYLMLVTERPLFARVAKDNFGSKRVLEKCGFKVIGEDTGYANARHAEIEEYILKLA